MTVYTGANVGTYDYAYDGNGNVAAIMNSANGVVAGQWEYGPFGEVIRATGPLAKSNLIRFSSQYQDDETSLCYYGHRYYDSSAGRWINRDLVEEEGGIILYGFVRNAQINNVEILGLQFFGYNLSSGQYNGAYNYLPDGQMVTPVGNTSLLGYWGNNGQSVVLSGPWSMFTYGIIAPPFAKPQISAELIEKAKRIARANNEYDLMLKVRNLLKCGKSGGITLVPNTDIMFAIDPYAGIAHIGSWQLDLIGDMSWSCGGQVGDSNCDCIITGKFKAHVSKTWTFQPWGYNSLNAEFDTFRLWPTTLLMQ